MNGCPTLVVHVPLEAEPRAHYANVSTRADYARLTLWLNGRRDGLDLLLDDWREQMRADPLGAHVIPSGWSVYAGRTLDEIGATAVGERWLATMLARLVADDPMRPPVERYVRQKLPGLYQRYLAWLESECAAEAAVAVAAA